MASSAKTLFLGLGLNCSFPAAGLLGDARATFSRFIGSGCGYRRGSRKKTCRSSEKATVSGEREEDKTAKPAPPPRTSKSMAATSRNPRPVLWKLPLPGRQASLGRPRCWLPQLLIILADRQLLLEHLGAGPFLRQ